MHIGKITGYIFSLLKEISDKYEGEELKTLYIGGGTPSLLSFFQINKLNDFFLSNNVFTDDFEFTIEVNPDDVSESFIESINQLIVFPVVCNL